MLTPGLYEQVISKALGQAIDGDSEHYIETLPIDAAEASKILSRYITEILEKSLDDVKDQGGDLRAQVDVANRIVQILADATGNTEVDLLSVDARAEQLMALLNKQNSIYAIQDKPKIPRPETSIARSSLFTGAIHEPQMFSELKKEIASADRIDMLVSFIKWSGLRLIIDDLRTFTERGGELRIITTSYMGATDIKAIEELRQLLNAKIKVSYDTKRTRLHAKTYVFYRESGYTTAYVGSSNLSNAAISSGLEWNVKVTRKDLPETIDKIAATFESYWNSSEFEYYSEDQKERLARALKAERYHEANNAEAFTLDIAPYAFQQEILDRLEAEREVRGFYRNLIVAATGTGKTVISALDYKRFQKQNPGKPCRLLFVAHREEILMQSLYTFRAVLKDPNFGEMFVGAYRPDTIDHLFLSIQTFRSQDFARKTSADFYDYIVVDEFHHAAAPSYQKLLEYYQPRILLGLTATPERMDGKSVLSYFGDRIAAEIRLPEAIERKLLCPFQYFGVTDTVDLDDLKWSVGGYDKGELSRIYTLSGIIAKRRADQIVTSLFKYITDIDEVKGLGFCVSIEHANFMCDFFQERGIPSLRLTGQSPDDERRTAKQRLVSGEDKECLTVLDFIGQANKRYNFEDKFAALLSNTNHSVTREIKNGFISAPKGCYIQLEKKAAAHILENIRASYGNTAGLISRIATFEEDTGKPLRLSEFLDHYHIDPRAIYKFSSFSRLSARADVIPEFEEPLEEILTKAFPRFATIDSRRLIAFLLRGLSEDITPTSDAEQRMLQMFQYTLYQKSAEDCGFATPLDGLRRVRENPVLCAELRALLTYNYNRIDFIDEPVDLGFDSPLDLHCTYTRDQILLALDFDKPSTVREGVKWLPEKNLDIFFITLNKIEKDYSPTTMYNDYSISDTLFHWQSQSTTSDTSPTGKRYIHHKQEGTRIALFVREFKTDHLHGGTAPYTYLGTASYVQHDGSRPMNVTWKLDRAIPAKYLKKTNKLVVG